MDHTMDNFVWHDAVLKTLSIEAHNDSSRSNCRISLLAYENAESRKRHRTEIVASSVLSVVSSIDFAELADNAGAGNVSNGYVKRTTSKSRGSLQILRMYLCDGFIEVVARRFEWSGPAKVRHG